MTATDFIMLGRLSPRALAAGALGFNLYQPRSCFGLGVVGALSPIAAAKIGAGESGDALRRATHQSLLVCGRSSPSSPGSLSRQTDPFLLAIGEPADLARDAGTYMRGFQWSLLPSLLFIAARCIFSALERPRPTLIAGLVAVAFNALANYALVFGKLGMPALGIIGSGIATTLSQTLDVPHPARGLIRRSAPAAASAVRPALAPGAARARRALAAWPADGRDDPRRSRRVLRRDDGHGPDRHERRSKRTRPPCRSCRSPSWSRSAWARRRPFGSALPTARATPVRSRARAGAPSASRSSTPSCQRRR